MTFIIYWFVLAYDTSITLLQISVSKVSLHFLKKKGDKPKGKTGRGKNKKHEVSFTSEDQVEIITNDTEEDTPDTQLDDKNDKGFNLGKLRTCY